MAEKQPQDNTTGHQWDGEDGQPLKELNNPLPRWWLYSFYATIVWAIVYWVLYPAWPLVSSFTKGALGWSQYKQLDEELKGLAAQRKPYDDKLASMTITDIAKDPKLLEFAKSGGKAVFGDNCAPCHGSGGVGNPGFPSLVDDDWLYGGDFNTLVETISNGRGGMMPAHLDKAGGAYTEAQVNDLAEYVLSLSGGKGDAAAVKRGDELFHGAAACNICHGDAGKGSVKDSTGGQKIDASIGAPNLTDKIWLYGGDKATVVASIAQGRNGKMPAWAEKSEGTNRKLDALSVKKAAIYVHTLSGGK